MLKATLYKAPYGQWPVVYSIVDGRCVFTGVVNAFRRPSTINFAEEIIQAICDCENLNPRSMIFFDLQTSLGYRDKDTGEFDYDEITFSDTPGQDHLAWTPTRCPECVIDEFRWYITGPSRPDKIQQQNTPPDPELN